MTPYETFPSTYVRRQALAKLAACYEARRQTKTPKPATSTTKEK